jgi:hypothetical protein
MLPSPPYRFLLRVFQFWLFSCLTFCVFANFNLPKDHSSLRHFSSPLNGIQFDAELTPNGQLVFLGKNTVVVDAEGAQLGSHAYGDSRQVIWDMPPSLSIDADGGQHSVVRVGGSLDEGHVINYRYRHNNDEWESPIKISDPVSRNYNVAVVGINQDLAYVVMSAGADGVQGNLHFYTINKGVVTHDGSFSGIYRSDNRVDMVRAGNWIYLACGYNYPNGAAFLMRAELGSDIYNQLNSSLRSFKPVATGDLRRGFPNITPAPGSTVDFVMGTQEGRLYWGRTKLDFPLGFTSLKLIFDNLGPWHLSIGRGAVGTSDDGKVVLAVALRSEGGTYGDGPLVAKASYDGGDTFGEEFQIHPNVTGGEGRTRIKVIPHGTTFFIAYTADDAIHVARFDAYSDEVVKQEYYLDGNDIVFLKKSEAAQTYSLYQFNSEWTNVSEVGESKMGTGSHLIWRAPAASGFLGYIESTANP